MNWKRTGMPGIILENPKCSMEHIFCASFCTQQQQKVSIINKNLFDLSSASFPLSISGGWETG